jgi:sugar/nucleoside kinase (ribokinase family)
MTRRGIVLAGIVVLDIVHIIDHWPAEETLAFIDRTAFAAGGPPHNAGAGLLKLGANFPVTLLATAGDDAYGETMLASAQGYGLDTSHVSVIPGAVTSHTHVMSCRDTGRRTFFAQLGCNNLMKVEHLLPPEGSTAKLYYLGSPGTALGLDEGDGWRVLLKAARARGMKTCLELCPVPAEALRKYVPPCLPLCDVFVVNDYEAGSITGVEVARGGRLSWEAAEEACRRLLAMGVSELAGVHHPDGAVAVRHDGEVSRRPSVKVDPAEIAGSTGAGDAFYAGLLFGLHDDWPLDRCLDLGNAAAATSLHSPTTSASIRPWAECLAYAADKGLRPGPLDDLSLTLTKT